MARSSSLSSSSVHISSAAPDKFLVGDEAAEGEAGGCVKNSELITSVGGSCTSLNTASTTEKRVGNAAGGAQYGKAPTAVQFTGLFTPCDAETSGRLEPVFDGRKFSGMQLESA